MGNNRLQQAQDNPRIYLKSCLGQTDACEFSRCFWAPSVSVYNMARLSFLGQSLKIGVNEGELDSETPNLKMQTNGDRK